MGAGTGSFRLDSGADDQEKKAQPPTEIGRGVSLFATAIPPLNQFTEGYLPIRVQIVHVKEKGVKLDVRVIGNPPPQPPPPHDLETLSDEATLLAFKNLQREYEAAFQTIQELEIFCQVRHVPHVVQRRKWGDGHRADAVVIILPFARAVEG